MPLNPGKNAWIQYARRFTHLKTNCFRPLANFSYVHPWAPAGWGARVGNRPPPPNFVSLYMYMLFCYPFSSWGSFRHIFSTWGTLFVVMGDFFGLPPYKNVCGHTWLHPSTPSDYCRVWRTWFERSKIVFKQ